MDAKIARLVPTTTSRPQPLCYHFSKKMTFAFRSKTGIAHFPRLFRVRVLTFRSDMELKLTIAPASLNQFQYYFDVDPERSRRAALSMGAFNSTSMFRDFPFPFEQLPTDGVVVDVGGGGGHVSAELSRKYHHLKFVVQDLGESIASGAANPEFSGLPIEWQEHGLFEPQAVLHADAYIIRHVLHGFQDEIAAEILGYISKAMDPNRSRILIIDCVVPEAFGSDSIPFVNATDVLALLGGNGKQRDAKAWDALVKMADERLQVMKIWYQRHLASADAVIEIRMTSNL